MDTFLQGPYLSFVRDGRACQEMSAAFLDKPPSSPPPVDPAHRFHTSGRDASVAVVVAAVAVEVVVAELAASEPAVAGVAVSGPVRRCS